MGDLKIIRFILYNLYLFKRKIVFNTNKMYNKFQKKENFDRKNNENQNILSSNTLIAKLWQIAKFV